MDAAGLTMTVNALCKLREVEAAMSPVRGWQALAQAIEREAPTMSEHELSVAFDATCKLKALETAMTSSGWYVLALRMEELAPKMKALQLVHTLRATSLLPGVVIELSPLAWERLAAGAARAGNTGLRQVARDMLCDACDVLDLPPPPRTKLQRSSVHDDGSDGSGSGGGSIGDNGSRGNGGGIGDSGSSDNGGGGVEVCDGIGGDGEGRRAT
uniref:Uncharacterized protein n=1 Tax=Mantoniella antarctica TaxID=81844 RepID=A0A7S0SEC8_9CHLO